MLDDSKEAAIRSGLEALKEQERSMIRNPNLFIREVERLQPAQSCCWLGSNHPCLSERGVLSHSCGQGGALTMTCS